MKGFFVFARCAFGVALRSADKKAQHHLQPFCCYHQTMRRLLFNLSSGLSIILCLALIVSWVRSYRLTDYVTFRRVDLAISRGRVNAGVFLAPDHAESFEWHTRDPRDVQYDFFEDALLGGSWHHYLYGFGIAEYGDSRIPEHNLMMIQPLWFLMALTAILPILWACKRWRNARSARSTRGFDLMPAENAPPSANALAETSSRTNF